ncbi:MAG TPA: hypothetical protein VF169_20890 [Albitalea sp.]|uniref:hypothetical protein n=1 Tax=Piscinibacter sp. TaxID=1903157 RepID=UPI002ED3F20E
MSDRPRHDADSRAEIVSPLQLGGAMRITQEQLAAAERTRAYHLRKLLDRVAPEEPEGESAAHAEH